MSGLVSLPIASRWMPMLLFLAVAMLTAAPAIVAGPLAHDSFWIDYVWADRFHAALVEGSLYPRWLAGSFDGLGAPVFYFYAPIAFYAAAGAITLGLGIFPALIATFAGFHLLSGIAMHRWLGGRGPGAVGGALLYMLLPYHVVDFHRRGALAEFAAFAVLPLVAHGLARIGRGGGPGVLALAYATLVMTHLPTALLTSVLLVPALALHRNNRPRLPVTALGLVLGLGMAAIYLLPALTLQPFANMAVLWADRGYDPAAWSLFRPARGISHDAVLDFGMLSVVVALVALGSWRRQACFWPLLSLGTCLVAANLVPGFWSLPLMAKVQFPWRALTIAEFATATAFAHAIMDPKRRIAAYCSLLPAFAITVSTIMLPFSIAPVDMGPLDRDRPDVTEYLPAHTLLNSSEAAVALARAHPERTDIGRWSIRRRFWFPDVVVRCDGHAVATRPDPATGLVVHPKGNDCVLSNAPPRVARLGGLLSGLFLLLTLATMAVHPFTLRHVMPGGTGSRGTASWQTSAASRSI